MVKKKGKSVQPLQEKAAYKSFPVLHRHSCMIVQRLLQVGKSPLNLIVRVGIPARSGRRKVNK